MLKFSIFHHNHHPSGDQPFIDDILSDRAVEPTFFDGYQAQRVIDAALHSDQQGKWVSIA